MRANERDQNAAIARLAASGRLSCKLVRASKRGRSMISGPTQTLDKAWKRSSRKGTPSASQWRASVDGEEPLKGIGGISGSSKGRFHCSAAQA